MKKRNTLVSLIASFAVIPILAFLSGCRVPNSINPPYQKPIVFSFIDEEGKKKTVSSYHHRFAESHTSSHVINIKGRGLESENYVGTGLIGPSEVDRFNGKSIYSYPLIKQKEINKDYHDYLISVEAYQQERINTKRKPVREKIKKEAARRIEKELQN